MENDKTSKPFITYDPVLARETDVNTSLVLSYIAFRTGGKQSVEAFGLRWAQINPVDLAKMLCVGKSTVYRIIKKAETEKLIKATHEHGFDGNSNGKRLLACNTPAIEQAAPGCWLIDRLKENMGKPAFGIRVTTDFNSVENLGKTLSNNSQNENPIPTGENPIPKLGQQNFKNTPSDLRFSSKTTPLQEDIEEGMERNATQESSEEDRSRNATQRNATQEPGRDPTKQPSDDELDETWRSLMDDFTEPDDAAERTTGGASSVTGGSLHPAAGFPSEPVNAGKPDADAARGFDMLAGALAETMADNAAGRAGGARDRHPSPSEVDAFLDRQGGAGFTGAEFCAVMERRGWQTDDGFPIRNWQMAVMQWVFMAEAEKAQAAGEAERPERLKAVAA